VTDPGVKRTPHELLLLLGIVAGAPGCDDDCEPSPVGPGNQDPVSLAACPALPPGVEPIDGLSVVHATDRFGGVVLTLSTRTLACGEVAAQHEYCRGSDRGLTIGLPAELAAVGETTLGHPVFVEFETPDRLSVGANFKVAETSLEIFALTDTCVTGRIAGLAAQGGPFEGGFQAPRCSP
jgi:hypothetical protein